jgi:hypothetical protein
MNKARCRPGDLAVVIDAHNQTNLGRIVQVIGPDDGKGDLKFPKDMLVWIVESHKNMCWQVGKRKVRRKRGPAPDAQLQPIRGYRSALDNATLRNPVASEQPAPIQTTL